MSGAMDNVQWVHVDAIRPEGEYDDRPLDWFVERGVKIAFAAAGGWPEHMWVAVTGVDGDRLVGELDNHPVGVPDLKCGDRVELGRGQVEAVYLSRDEWVAEVDRLWGRAEFSDPRLGLRKPPPEIAALHAAGFTPLLALRRWAVCRPTAGSGRTPARKGRTRSRKSR